jgi:SAM-dependent methyltransferase
MTTWDGDDYQRRLDANLADAEDPHGEVAFVQRYAPSSVLDAGCGTGRVAIELDRRGIEVVGADLDPSMLATARRLDPHVPWVQTDLGALDLGRTFDVVVMAGNVLLFTPPGTEADVVAGCARHLAPGGLLIAGFQRSGRYPLERYDADAEAADLELVERYASWHLDPFEATSDYAVSVHRRTSTVTRG